MLDDGSFFTTPQTVTHSLMSAPTPATEPPGSVVTESQTTPPEEPTPPLLPSASKTEQFLLTAADQESGSRDERVQPSHQKQVRSRFVEAVRLRQGLRPPLAMDRPQVDRHSSVESFSNENRLPVSRQSKQQILQPFSVLRPKFKAVAQSLRDIDLVFIEEAFEHLLLDYDRVFSAIGVPACLWHRIGEIYKGNREFSKLVGVGRLCIYELMAEESTVNYWEKYGHVAFDSAQKAVLTSCVLRYKPLINTLSDRKKLANKDAPSEEGFIKCRSQLYQSK